jgi:hypothetical protein
MVVDREYHRQLKDGTVRPPCEELVFLTANYGDVLGAHQAAHDLVAQFNGPWRHRYPSESPIWVVNVPGGYALVPNGLFSPNMAWKDAMGYVRELRARRKPKYCVRWNHNGRDWESRYYTDYHADQYARALRLNGLTVNIVIDEPVEQPG